MSTTNTANKDDTPEIENQTVLVTGGAGLVGRRLVEALYLHNEVRVLDHFQSSEPASLPKDVELYRGDIRDEELLEAATEGVDLIFHQAATSIPYAQQYPEESRDVNADATLELLECANDQNARLVFASSAAIYGEVQETPLQEDGPTLPKSPYGQQKLIADRKVRKHNQDYDTETVVLRYFNVYGKRRKGSSRTSVVNIFVDQACNGGSITLEGDGQQTRDFVHVSDVVHANLLAAKTACVGEAFNIGTGTQVSVKQLAKKVISRTPCDPQEVDIVHTDGGESGVENSVANTARAEKRLGFSSSRTLESGLQNLCE